MSKFIFIFSFVLAVTLSCVFAGCAHVQTKSTEIRSVLFGLFDDDDYLLPTTQIPYVTGLHYGWALTVHSAKNKVRVKEIFQLPATAPWLNDDSQVPDGIKVISDWHSRSGDVRISEFDVELKPNGNAADETDIIMPYRIVNGDPKGTYEISVFVEGKFVRKFTFQVLPSKWPTDERGSATNSGSAQSQTAINKLTQFELLDDRGNVIPPKPDADFPEIISTNLYPRFLAPSFIGYFETATNKEPLRITELHYDNLFPVTNAGDYMLIVQPVLYKRKLSNSNLIERADSPCITTKVYLEPD